MAFNQEIAQLRQETAEQTKILKRIEKMCDDHERTLYGSQDGKEFSHSERIKDLEAVNREREKKKKRALIGITALSIGSGAGASKWETIVKFLTTLGS